MRIGDILYFSPNYKFTQIEWDNGEQLVNAFKDRVKGFYLQPAEDLNKKGYGFIVGLVCVATIDFLARVSIGGNVGNRFGTWLYKNTTEFKRKDPDNTNRTLSRRFYDEFRHGLVHEGRIKNCGQFSYEIEDLVSINNGVMLVNPECLLGKIKKAFEEYMQKVEENEKDFREFKRALKKDFQRDVEYASTG